MFFSWFLKISTFFFWNHWMEHMNIFISVFQKLISFIFEWERVVFVTSAKNENIGKLNCRLPHLQPELLNFAFLTCFHAHTHTHHTYIHTTSHSQVLAKSVVFSLWFSLKRGKLSTVKQNCAKIQDVIQKTLWKHSKYRKTNLALFFDFTSWNKQKCGNFETIVYFGAQPAVWCE